MTDNDQSDSCPDPEEDASRGRFVGELKLELVNPSADQNERKRTVKDPLKDLSFLVSVLTLAVVGWYAWEAHVANGIASKAFLNSDRPWAGFIVADSKINDFEVGKRPWVTMVMENFGKSPALNLSARDFMALIGANSPSDARVGLYFLKNTKLGTLWPSEQMRTIVTIDSPLTQAQIDQINNRTLTLGVAGDLVYQDRTMIGWHRTCVDSVYEPSIKAMTARPCNDSRDNPDN